MESRISIPLPSLEATETFGGKFAQALIVQPARLLVIYLTGDLGAGKTTFVRSVLRGLGHLGSVKSPTYTLVEEYDLANKKIYHFDLYRLADPEELEFMGIRDFVGDSVSQSEDLLTICFVEWPSKGEGILPKANIFVELEIEGDGRVMSLTIPSDQDIDATMFFDALSVD